MAKRTNQVACPRCSGTGVYAGFGVCFRCHGKGVVNATPKRAPRAALVETDEQRDARMRELLGEADFRVWKRGYTYD